MLRHFVISAGVLLAAIIFATKIVEWWTEAWWFEETGYSTVYLKIFLTRLVSFIAGAVIFGSVVGVQVRTAWRVVARDKATTRDTAVARAIIAEVSALTVPQQTRYFERYHRWFWSVGVLVPTLLAAQLASTRWMLWQHFATPITSGMREPLHHRDVSFYLLQLPALNFVWSFVFGALLCALALTLFIYGLEGMLGTAPGTDRGNANRPGNQSRFPAPLPVVRHLAQLTAALMLWKATGYQLSPYNLAVAHNGAFYGAGYTDVYWRLPLILLLTTVSLAAALATFWLSRRTTPRQMPHVWRPLQAYLLASVILGSGIPWLVQRFVVEPGEPAREQPFILRHIEWTRRSYDLTRIESWPSGVLEDDLPAITAQLPAWPAPALLELLNQQDAGGRFQARSVHLDAYAINQEKRAVFVAARELALEALPNLDWRSTRLLHNFGAGVTVADVQRTGSGGWPLLYQTAPTKRPISGRGLKVEHPELFFAEFPTPANREPFIPPTRSISSPPGLTMSPRDVTAGQPSNSAPPISNSRAVWAPAPAYAVLNSRNSLHPYSGQGGVEVQTMWRKWLLAWRFLDFRLALSPEVEANSRILWHRRIVERCRQLAPFISFDAAHPYPVITDDGRILWLLDGFTLSNTYPYAAPIDGIGGVNYVRNSVKATVDAYDGKVQFYIADATDPIIRSNRVIFPELFLPLAEMPADVRRHLRYPASLLTAQARIWGRYHTGDAGQWLAAEEVWSPSARQWGTERTVGTERFRATASLSIAPVLAMRTAMPTGTPSTPDLSLTTISPLFPSGSQTGPVSSGTSNAPLRVAAILLASPGQPLREWRPATPISLPRTQQTASPVTQIGAPSQSSSVALLPHGNRLLYLKGMLQSAGGNMGLAVRWGIAGPDGSRSYASRRDIIGALTSQGSNARKNATVPVRDGSVSPAQSTIPGNIRQLRAYFESMQNARKRGDWRAYGQAENKIERLLER